jgi:hypothetical protein
MYYLPMVVNESVVSDRNLCLVSGYHAATYPPDAAYEAGLGHRFAVVLDTYRKDKADMFYDSDLVLLLVPKLCQIIGFDQLEIRMADGTRFQSFEELTRYQNGQREADRDPPNWMELCSGGKLSGIVETESWMAVGGPPPYHDSCTLSFYTADDRSMEFRQLSEHVCSEAGACITGFHVGSQVKEPYSNRPWWMKVWNWFAGS